MKNSYGQFKICYISRNNRKNKNAPKISLYSPDVKNRIVYFFCSGFAILNSKRAKQKAPIVRPV